MRCIRRIKGVPMGSIKKCISISKIDVFCMIQVNFKKQIYSFTLFYSQLNFRQRMCLWSDIAPTISDIWSIFLGILLPLTFSYKTHRNKSDITFMTAFYWDKMLLCTFFSLFLSVFLSQILSLYLSAQNWHVWIQITCIYYNIWNIKTCVFVNLNLRKNKTSKKIQSINVNFP